MTTPANPFLTGAPAPATATPTTPAPAPATDPTQDPAYQAFLAQQAAAQAAAVPAPAAPAPVQDPAYAAFLAQQQAAQAAAAAVPVAPVAPVAPQPQAVAQPGGAPDPFDDPAPPRAKGPRLQEMANRLLLVIPKLVETVRQKDDETGEMKDVRRMTADVVVLDGGPIAFGGKPEGRPPTQHDKVAEIPYRAVAMYISAVGLVSQCETALDKRKRGETAGTMVIGRLGYGEQRDPKRQAPWLLMKATDADRAAARAYLATINPFD